MSAPIGVSIVPGHTALIRIIGFSEHRKECEASIVEATIVDYQRYDFSLGTGLVCTNCDAPPDEVTTISRAAEDHAERMREAIAKSGVEMGWLDADLQSRANKMTKLLRRNLAKADSLGLTGTPAYNPAT